jgi:hypothetical protein
MNCSRPSCGQPIRTCPNKRDMGSCAYFACTGYIHTATDLHACEDLQGEATPAAATLPLLETPATRPAGEVA